MITISMFVFVLMCLVIILFVVVTYRMAYPAILKGKRVIIPGAMNQLAALLGKILPFPWAMRVMEFIYNQNVDQAATTYPL